MNYLDSALQQIRRNSASIKRATWNALIVTSGVAVTRLFALATSILLARVTGVETFGEFTLFTTVFILVSEIPGVFDTTYIRFSNAHGGDAKHHEFLVTNLATKIAYLVTLNLIGFFAGALLADHVFHKPGATDIIRSAVLAGSLYTIFATLIATHQRRSRFVHVSAMRIAFSLIVLSGLGVLVWLGVIPTLRDVSMLYICSAGGLGLVGAFLIVRQVVSSEGVSFYRQPDYFRVALVLLLAEMVNQTSNRLDVFFLAAFVGFEDIGLYGSAIRVSVVVAIMTTTVSTVMLPKAAAALHDARKLKRYIALALFYAAIQTGIAVLVVTYMEHLIVLLFGERYLPARDIASLLVVQVLVTAYGSPAQSLVQCGRHPSHMFYIALTKPALNVLMLPPMIGWYGLTGAALAVAITAGAVTLLMIGAAWHTAGPRLTAKGDS